MSGHTPWREISLKTDADEHGPGWAAHIECTGDPAGADDTFEDPLLEFVDELLPVGGCVSARTTNDRYAATFSVYTDSNSVTEVVDLALAIFLEAAVKADLPPWPVVKSEAMTFAEQDAEIREPSPN
ncbi:MAG TPA: hypothetical protein VGN51_16015 [Acidimicrobiia bacterium]|jgi:hypothetical protein